MIYVIVGDPGMGKGIMACEFMEQAWLAGRPVVTNIDLLPACPFYDEAVKVGTPDFPIYDERSGLGFWDFIIPYGLKGAVCVFDEADVFFDCSDHSKMGKAVNVALKHHRKLKLDILLVVQNLSNLYVRIRRLCNIVWAAEWTYRTAPGFQYIGEIIGQEWAKRLTSFRRFQFQDISLRDPVGVTKMSYSAVKAKYFDNPWYDTDQLVGDWTSRITPEVDNANT